MQQRQKEWGQTKAYQEYKQKNGKRSQQTEPVIAQGLMTISSNFGNQKIEDPSSPRSSGTYASFTGIHYRELLYLHPRNPEYSRYFIYESPPP